MVKLCGILVTHNENEDGFLERNLQNLRQYCDWIVVYDDASTDGSMRMIKEYTDHVIEGTRRLNFPTLPHKQAILDYIKNNEDINPDWVIWLDADEILDNYGTQHIKDFICTISPEVKGVKFQEINLWRSNCYKRLDSLFDAGWFCRLWRYHPDLKMANIKHLHPRPYPVNLLDKITWTDKIKVIHFGFSSTDRLVRKIRNYRELGRARSIYDRYLNEKELVQLEKLPLEIYPEHCCPGEETSRPAPLTREQWRERIGKDLI